MPAMPSNDKSPAVSRRDFLSLFTRITLALSGILGLGGLLRYFDAPDGPPPQTEFDLGPADQYLFGSDTVLSRSQAVLRRTPQEFIAFSTVCPHLGCQVEAGEDGFSCPCHGSQFDNHGKLLRGPAKSDLRRLHVDLDEDGNLTLSTN